MPLSGCRYLFADDDPFFAARRPSALVQDSGSCRGSLTIDVRN
jgi:hypothetical protein